MKLRAACVAIACFCAASAAPGQVAKDDGTRRGVVQLPLTQCFAEGADSAVVDLENELLRVLWEDWSPADEELGRFFTSGGWGLAGRPIEVTWSLVPDGALVCDRGGECGQPSQLFATMDNQFALAGGRETWIELIERGFGRWTALTGITFRRVGMPGADWDDGAPQVLGRNDESPTRGQVRIGMAPVDGRGGVLAFAYFPNSGGDIVLDPAEQWSGAGSDFVFLRNVVMHEIGHSIGIRHVCSMTDAFLMAPNLTTLIDGPRHDDVRAGQDRYGDIFEPNDSPAESRPLGDLLTGQEIVIGMPPAPFLGATSLLSLRTSADRDLFTVRFPNPARATFEVRPIGRIYEDTPQGFDGCSFGVFTDSLRQLPLAVRALNEQASGVLGEATEPTPGLAVTLADVAVGSGQTVTVEVGAAGTGGIGQQYELVVRAEAADCRADITSTGAATPGFPGFGQPDGVADGDDLAAYLGLWLAQDPAADATTTGSTNPVGAGFGVPDGAVDGDDLSVFLLFWLAGCN